MLASQLRILSSMMMMMTIARPSTTDTINKAAQISSPIAKEPVPDLIATKVENTSGAPFPKPKKATRHFDNSYKTEEEHQPDYHQTNEDWSKHHNSNCGDSINKDYLSWNTVIKSELKTLGEAYSISQKKNLAC
ncbi:hypothetical protein PPACK8108_LOCUS2286 [Phakopsora pachyrhizi]|uniref:Secreted protein n=1 Tax=Phakopsora pachyrhizi TaxID=170000 RepID=A0AAV0AHI2_PHAPC|nr:hypothetical protein PPACK8108_LOCUS2286 [Phakopsora pachyrhizi]